MGKEEITRRGFLFGMAGGLAALVSGCSFSTETRRLEKNLVIPKDYGKKPERLNEANSFLFDLNDVPGTKRVEKYLTMDAKYCLVHIRQLHISRVMTFEESERIKKVQNNIYKILYYLHDNFAIDEVYTELISSDEELHENFNAQMSVPQRELEERLIADCKSQLKIMEGKQKDEKFISLLYPKKEEADNYREYLKRLVELKKSVLEELMWVHAQFELIEFKKINYFVAYRLAKEGKIKILGAEDKRMYNIGIAKLDAAGRITPDNVLDVLDNREDYIFARASGRKDPLVVCVFGGAHAFGGTHSFGDNYILKGKVSLIDNVAKHNLYHPDRKFSLIEITPEDYPD